MMRTSDSTFLVVQIFTDIEVQNFTVEYQNHQPQNILENWQSCFQRSKLPSREREVVKMIWCCSGPPHARESKLIDHPPKSSAKEAITTRTPRSTTTKSSNQDLGQVSHKSPTRLSPETKMSNPAIQVAETIQTASINRAPSPHHDINPSTSASYKEPVSLSRLPGDVSASDSDEIPEYVLHERSRRATLPPLPDLRFEQSYLKSIEGRDRLGVAWVTMRDQVVLPLVQGMMWTLALQGWRVWNRGANYSGRTAGCE
jgi:hypothetical protein